MSRLYDQYLAFRATIKFPEPYQREDTANHTARKERKERGAGRKAVEPSPCREGWRKGKSK